MSTGLLAVCAPGRRRSRACWAARGRTRLEPCRRRRPWAARCCCRPPGRNCCACCYSRFLPCDMSSPIQPVHEHHMALQTKISVQSSEWTCSGRLPSTLEADPSLVSGSSASSLRPAYPLASSVSLSPLAPRRRDCRCPLCASCSTLRRRQKRRMPTWTRSSGPRSPWAAEARGRAVRLPAARYGLVA